MISLSNIWIGISFHWIVLNYRNWSFLRLSKPLVLALIYISYILALSFIQFNLSLSLSFFTFSRKVSIETSHRTLVYNLFCTFAFVLAYTIKYMSILIYTCLFDICLNFIVLACSFLYIYIHLFVYTCLYMYIRYILF